MSVLCSNHRQLLLRDLPRLFVRFLSLFITVYSNNSLLNNNNSINNSNGNSNGTVLPIVEEHEDEGRVLLRSNNRKRIRVIKQQVRRYSQRGWKLSGVVHQIDQFVKVLGDKHLVTFRLILKNIILSKNLLWQCLTFVSILGYSKFQTSGHTAQEPVPKNFFVFGNVCKVKI